MYRLTTTLTALLLTALLVTASADVLNVPGDYQSVQEAVAVAQDGDTVLVGPGTYEETIDFDGKAIVLASLYLTTDDEQYIQSTVFDACSNGRVFTITPSEAGEASLIGVTVTSGCDANGGGVFVMGCSPTIDHCRFRDNVANAGGGLISVEASPTISYCTFYSNIANLGGAMMLVSSNVTVDHCTVYGNTAVTEGGGISAFETNLTVTYSIFWGNAPEQISLAGAGDPNTLDISFTDIEGGENGIDDNNNGDVNYGEGNLNVDPMFNDPDNGDFTLRDDSPLIGTGIGSNPREAEEPEIKDKRDPATLIEALIADINLLVTDRRITSRDGERLTNCLYRTLNNVEEDRYFIAVLNMIEFKLHLLGLWLRGGGNIRPVNPRLVEIALMLNERANEIIRALGSDNTDSLEEMAALYGDSVVPDEYYMNQNYPNPFNSTTSISYGVPEAGNVRIAVFDMTGRQVAVLVDGLQAAGEHTVSWNASTSPAGMYILRMEADSYTSTNQMMFTK